MSKPVVMSKVVWVNLILSLLAVLDLLGQSPIFPANFLPYLVFAAGVLNIILRVWFTDSPLKGLFSKG